MDGSIGSMSSTMEWGAYLGVFLVVLELAKRIASLTPGKADDEIVSNIERIVRKLIDFAAGQHTDRGDPGMIKPNKSKEES